MILWNAQHVWLIFTSDDCGLSTGLICSPNFGSLVKWQVGHLRSIPAILRSHGLFYPVTIRGWNHLVRIISTRGLCIGGSLVFSLFSSDIIDIPRIFPLPIAWIIPEFAPVPHDVRRFSDALVNRFEIQGRSLRQCRAAPRPELLRYAFKFQRWLVDELQVVVVPKELAELFAQDASLNIPEPDVTDVLQGFRGLPEPHVNAEIACKWLFEGVGVWLFFLRHIWVRSDRDDHR